MAELNDHLQPLPEQYQIVDKIYAQSYQYFKICNIVIILYATLRIITIPIVLFYTTLTELKIWFVSIMIISIIQNVGYFKVRTLANNLQIFYKIAEMLGHLNFMNSDALTAEQIRAQPRISEDTYDYNNAMVGEDEKRMKMLALQIKYLLQKQNMTLYYLSKVQFIIFQMFHFWGVILFFTINEPEEMVSSYLTVLIFLSTYQYLEFYLLFTFIVVIMPFWFLKRVYDSAVHRFKAWKFQRIMRGQPYDQNIQGDSQCKICLQEYVHHDNIIVLKCSQMHNFHLECFRDWSKISLTCPLCRSDVTSL